MYSRTLGGSVFASSPCARALQVVPAAGSALRSACKSVAVDACQPCPAFPTRASALAKEAWQRVYADRVSPVRAERGQLLQLLRQHLQDGLLRIGKRWLRQTRGIPQASRALATVHIRRRLPVSPPMAAHEHQLGKPAYCGTPGDRLRTWRSTSPFASAC